MPAPPTAKRIEMWPLDRLVPYERNARTHSPEQVAQIAASIQEFGFTNPLLVDGADGILAGHGRLAAAKDMGLAEVPVIVLDHLSAAQRKAYILADNQLALNAGWDTELLQMEVAALNLEDFDLSLLGFDEDRIAGLLEGGADVQELEEMPSLPSGDREPFQQMTFTLHDDQAELIKEAVQKAKGMGPFADTVNENSNGNGLARVAELFLSWGSDHGIG
jgi:ParB family transcriptional regulator, chromosome partitioning protein